MRMLVMPTDRHPTLDVKRNALVEPAATFAYFKDYLRLLDRLQTTEEFAVYVAQVGMQRRLHSEAAPPTSVGSGGLWRRCRLGSPMVSPFSPRGTVLSLASASSLSFC